MTGGLTWAILTSPLWGAMLAPSYLIWFLLVFNGYWVYKSANMAISALIGYRRLIEGQKTDWLGALDGLDGWERINHLVMVPTYREPPEVLEVMLDHLAAQDFPLQNVSVVLAFEERDLGARERAARLVAQFEGTFRNLWVTYHPDRRGGDPRQVVQPGVRRALGEARAGGRAWRGHPRRRRHRLRRRLAAAREVPERADARVRDQPVAPLRDLAAGA